MSGDTAARSADGKASPGAKQSVHALREAEESERLRQLGALVVHDLNNALFALHGRLQLLRRQIDPSAAKSVDSVLDSLKMIENQLTLLHAACPRDPIAVDSCRAREAVEQALAAAPETFPEGLLLSGIETTVASIPPQAVAEGDPSEIAAGVRQLLAFHRDRGATAITVAASLGDARGGDPYAVPRIALIFEDDAGRPAETPMAPSLLGGHFTLAALPLAAALRAIREMGGKVEAQPTTHGLRTTLSFEFRIERTDRPSEGAFDPEATNGLGSSAGDASFVRRILIADDDPGIRAVLVAMLDSEENDLESMDDPGGIARRDDLASFDMVILDAGGGGVEALREIRRRGVSVPVLLASGEMVSAPGDPRTECMMKPMGLAALEAAINRLCALSKPA